MLSTDTPRVVRLNADTFPMIDEERKILAEINAQVIEVEGTTDEEIAAAARDVDAVMIISAYLHGTVIQQLQRCRVISRLGTGVDKIDIPQATKQGILVTNLPDFCTHEVADHTMALLLAAARQVKFYDAQMRQGRQPHDVPEMHRLASRTLGIIGCGRIGRAVVARAQAFGMTILVNDPQLTPEAAASLGVTAVDRETVLAQADYLCLFCPLTPATRGMLTMREFRQMKPSAVLVNTGRGELVNENDLATALRDGILRFAAIDVFGGINVFAPEGFPTDHPYFSLDNVLLTPHVAAYSDEALFDSRIRGAQAVVDVLRGQWPQYPVNPEVTPWFALDRV